MKHGIHVDGKFSNENGIALQVSKLEYVFIYVKSGLSVKNGEYFDIVQLYKEEYEKYVELLEEVNEMSDPDTAKKKSFNVWLAENILSNATRIQSSINVLNILLLKNRSIQYNILQITDIEEIEILINRIKMNRNINIHFKHKKKVYLDALSMYKEYLVYLNAGEAKDNMSLEASQVTAKDAESMLTEDADEILHVSFTKPCTYKYTRPLDLEYFNEHYVMENWIQVYVQTLKCLFEDYPDKIRSLMNSRLGGRGRIDISDSAGADTMIEPKEITDDLYLETSESADDIIKKIGRLMDICEVDYENVFITYLASKSSAVTQNTTPVSTEGTPISPSKGNVSFYVWMIESQGMAAATGRSYDSAIDIADEYAKEHHVGCGKIRGTTDYTVVRETVDALFKTAEFIKFNQRQHNRLRVALRKYIQYLSKGSNAPKSREDIVEGVDFEPYKKILLEHFLKGFRISSRLDMGRFRTYWARKFGTELDVDDDTVRRYIAHLTIRYQDFVYLPETMLDDYIAERLLVYLSECFRAGKTAVYFDALYKKFQIEFVGKRINNSDMLKSYLAYINDGRFYIHRDYLTAEEDVEVNPIDEVRDYLITFGGSVKVEDIKEALSHIDADKIDWAVAGSNSAEFVRNRKGEYFCADIIHFTQTEIDMIMELIQEAIDDRDYMGGKELTNTIEIKIPDIKERYPFLTWLGLRDAIAYKLRDVFSFKGKIISAYSQDLSMSDVFARFANSHEYFKLEQLNSLKRDLDTPIYFNSVYANSLRINKDEFVSRNREAFDVAATDVAIDRFCTGDYIAVKEISFFGSFPDAGFPWNEFLLEHYVADFSRKYKLMHIGYTAETPVGAIVKRSSHFEKFDDLASTILADSNIHLNRQSALQYLADMGMIARRNYKGVEQILSKAKLQRLKKG